MKKPLLYLLYAAGFTAATALIYLFILPEAYVDLNAGKYYSIRLHTAWLVYSGYILLIWLVNTLAERSGYKAERWIIRTHLAFITLFYIFFFAFTLFNTALGRSLTAGLSFNALVTLYAAIAALDILLFAGSFLLLIANLYSMKRSEQHSGEANGRRLKQTEKKEPIGH